MALAESESSVVPTDGEQSQWRYLVLAPPIAVACFLLAALSIRVLGHGVVPLFLSLVAALSSLVGPPLGMLGLALDARRLRRAGSAWRPAWWWYVPAAASATIVLFLLGDRFSASAAENRGVAGVALVLGTAPVALLYLYRRHRALGRPRLEGWTRLLR